MSLPVEVLNFRFTPEQFITMNRISMSREIAHKYGRHPFYRRRRRRMAGK
jgi:hypothetical protein